MQSHRAGLQKRWSKNGMHDIRNLACKQNKLEIKQNINKITYLCICFTWCPSQFRVVVHDWIQGVADPECRSEEQEFANCLCKCLCGQVWFTPLSVTEAKSKKSPPDFFSFVLPYPKWLIWPVNFHCLFKCGPWVCLSALVLTAVAAFLLFLYSKWKGIWAFAI